MKATIALKRNVYTVNCILETKMIIPTFTPNRTAPRKYQQSDN